MPSNAPAMRKAGPITSLGWPRPPPGATRAPTRFTAAPAGYDRCALSLPRRSRRNRLVPQRVFRPARTPYLRAYKEAYQGQKTLPLHFEPLRHPVGLRRAKPSNTSGIPSGDFHLAILILYEENVRVLRPHVRLGSASVP